MNAQPSPLGVVCIRVVATCVTLVAVAFGAGPVRGQSHPPVSEVPMAPAAVWARDSARAAAGEVPGVLSPERPAASSLLRADSLYFHGDPAAAFRELEGHLALHPSDYDALWRVTRAGLILGVLAEGSRPQNAWLDPAMAFGDEAVALRTDGIDGLYWRGAAYGRRAMNASPGRAAELAQQVYEDAHQILALDSLHGGAYNLLGKLNYEVMSLSRIERALGRLLMGHEALREASWERAEAYLSRAAEVWPDLILFQFDLALLYEKRGRDAEAREALLRTLELPAIHPPDLSYQEEARRLLEELAGDE